MALVNRQPIYLDYHAHAPIDPRVARVLADAYTQFDANPHSSHWHGERAHQAVEAARRNIANLLGVEPSEVIFTSGATEANNLALAGIMPHLRDVGLACILVGAGEHPSVLAAASAASGGQVERVPLQVDGQLDLAVLEQLLKRPVGMVSVAAANHEIGTIQPLSQIAAAARAAGALFHSDLAQAAGKVRVDAANFDLASLSAHKLGGPVGIGALVIKRKLRRRLSPLHHGGGQENGLRAGTVPAPLCIAFGEACRLASEELEIDATRIATLRNELRDRLASVGAVAVNGGAERLPGNLNLSFANVDGEALVLRVRDRVSLSTGSACTSASLEPSHVLQAIGVIGRAAEGAIRIGLGRHTTAAEVHEAADVIMTAVRDLRATVRHAA